MSVTITNEPASISSELEWGLVSLLTILKNAGHSIEMLADEVQELNLRTALQSLAEESKQCASEIRARLKSSGIGLSDNVNIAGNPMVNAEDIPEQERGVGRELLHICNCIETAVLRSYKVIISQKKTAIPMLSSLLKLQLNLLRNCFVKVKLMNRARFA